MREREQRRGATDARCPGYENAGRKRHRTRRVLLNLWDQPVAAAPDRYINSIKANYAVTSRLADPSLPLRVRRTQHLSCCPGGSRSASADAADADHVGPGSWAIGRCRAAAPARPAACLLPGGVRG